MGIKGGYLSVKGAINVWEALVRSHLEYAGVVWKETWRDKREFEQIQADMAKRILRCSPFTTREAMYGDLGWWTLEGRRNYKKLVFWYNLMTLGDERILKKVYLVTKRIGKKSWAHSIKDVLETYGLANLWSDEQLLFNLDGKGNLGSKTLLNHKRFWKRYIRGKIQEYEQKMWWSNLTERHEDISQSKTRTYVTFKKTLRLEKYLQAHSDAQGRAIHTSLRSGTNKLEIEIGRWSGIEKSRRFCKQCDLKEVESEMHFLMHCPRYEALRDKFYSSVRFVSGGKWDFRARSSEEGFSVLMQGTGDEFEKIIFRLFHSYLVKC